MVKVALYLSAFYLVYSTMLSRDTSYGRNRIFIFFSLTSALIFPIITLQTGKPLDIQFFGKYLEDVFIVSDRGPVNFFRFGSLTVSYIQIIFLIYISGVTVFILKLLIDLVNLLYLIARRKSKGSRIIRFHGFSTAGFSAMGYIFVNIHLSPEEAGEIIRHEQNHLRQNHFIDIILVEIIKGLQWFNPVIYLFDRSLRAIHEYQADRGCLSSGVSVVNYQSLLLSQVFKSGVFNLTNSFSNPSLIKKRMIMMTKKPTSALADMKILMVIPVISFVFLAISACKENQFPDQILDNTSLSQKLSGSETVTDVLPPPPPPPPPSGSGMSNQVSIAKEEYTEENEAAPFVVVEEMPLFPGGDAALLRYIGENTKYPEAAREKNIQGRVIVRFCVTEKGSVNRVSVIKGVYPELDAEAIRVVNSLPLFKPGRQGGKEVPVWYMVPISFSLK